MGSEWALPRLVRPGWIRILLFWLLHIDLVFQSRRGSRCTSMHPGSGPIRSIPTLTAWQFSPAAGSSFNHRTPSVDPKASASGLSGEEPTIMTHMMDRK
ncbi:hypothetical protein EDD18DRAFT_331662 [Armillaria luteobubalina]|uniref:Uncharacterized protein n=1 Tax=Armillaria luteobubalina TaxID=153913 RepID=A0AA39QLS1_9AGAR|nr:hypothetical protein EDD18DRAFT_331662 [Armillaria luteobubalina]